MRSPLEKCSCAVSVAGQAVLTPLWSFHFRDDRLILHANGEARREKSPNFHAVIEKKERFFCVKKVKKRRVNVRILCGTNTTCNCMVPVSHQKNNKRNLQDMEGETVFIFQNPRL